MHGMLIVDVSYRDSCHSVEKTYDGDAGYCLDGVVLLDGGSGDYVCSYGDQ